MKKGPVAHENPELPRSLKVKMLAKLKTAPVLLLSGVPTYQVLNQIAE
jgi:hypothetical protein